LEIDAGDAAQGFTMAKDLLRYFVRVADEERATRAELGVEARAGDGRPAAFLCDAADGTGIAGKELIGGYLARGGHIAKRVYTDLELVRGVAGLLARLSVEIDRRTEAARLAADDYTSTPLITLTLVAYYVDPLGRCGGANDGADGPPRPPLAPDQRHDHCGD
jgi:hypothetical protein